MFLAEGLPWTAGLDTEIPTDQKIDNLHYITIIKIRMFHISISTYTYYLSLCNDLPPGSLFRAQHGTSRSEDKISMHGAGDGVSGHAFYICVSLDRDVIKMN